MIVLHWINVFLGTNSQDGFMYKFWSGFAGNLILVVAMYKWYKHNKCIGCFRLGHHVPHLHRPVCKHHIPKEVES